MKNHTSKSNLEKANSLMMLKRDSMQDKVLDFVCIAGICACILWMISLYAQY